MKRLTAQRPILYGGRMYEAGDTLPAHDKRMVQAWLSAKSAAVIDDAAEVPPPPADDDGSQNDAEATQATEDTGDTEGAADETQSGDTGTEMVEGHLTTEQLEEMTKDDLKKLAKDMGVDLPRGAAKALIVERLAAVTVQAPADNGGGAQ